MRGGVNVVQASQLFEPVQASSPHLIVIKPKAGVVDVSSSDIEDLLNSLILSPTCDSPSLHRSASSVADSFESRPEVNNIATSVYVALSADASSSHKPMIDAPHDNQRSHFNNLTVQKMRKTRRGKAEPSDILRERSKKANVDIDCALATPAARDDPLSAASFARSECEIMYLLFVVEGLIDTSARVNRKDT
jgi:hypothetical protein